jgi:hypothetical protein
MSGKAKPGNEVCEIELSNVRSSNRFVAGDKLCCLRATLVNDGKDRVESLGKGEIGDEIHRHLLEWSSLYICIKAL